MKSTEPTNIFKLGVKVTGQSAPTISNVKFNNACSTRLKLNNNIHVNTIMTLTFRINNTEKRLTIVVRHMQLVHAVDIQ